MMSIRQWVTWNQEVTKHYKREDVKKITGNNDGDKMYLHLNNGERHTWKLKRTAALNEIWTGYWERLS